ncbi:MAG TPA: glycosyltransferase family 9 protein, partial [Gemmatimonadales bacterium]|nr:glycosyltransferase family 9 protein [Gemmatimonadales bacterium]
TTPLIRRAAERLGAPVDVVCQPQAAEVLHNNPHVRDIVPYDKKGTERSPVALWRLARKLRSRHYAVAYCAQSSPRTALLAWLARIPMRVGFRGARAGILYTHAVMTRAEPHAVERYLALADGAPDRREPEIFPSASDRKVVDDLLEEAGIGREFIALAPGAAWATKRWPYFPELARALADEAPLAIVGGPGDRADARAIRTAVGSATVILDATGRLSLVQSGELIRRALLLVSNDSAPVHLASATGTPVVMIYGPTVPQFGFAARARHSRIVEPDPLPCRPCSPHGPAVCPLLHHKCMREQPIGRVLAEARVVLQIVRTHRRA